MQYTYIYSERVASQGAQERRRALRRAAGGGGGRQAQPQPAAVEEGLPGGGVGRRAARGAGLRRPRAVCVVAVVRVTLPYPALPTYFPAHPLFRIDPMRTKITHA